MKKAPGSQAGKARGLAAAVLVIALACSTLALGSWSGAGSSAQGFDLDTVSLLPILDGGRAKILNTYAHETVRFITGKERFRDQDPLYFLLSLAFETDRWLKEDIVAVPYLPLKKKIGLEPGVKHVSPASLIRNPEYRSFLEEIRRSGVASEDLPPLEKEAMTLYHRMAVLESLYEGQSWKLVGDGESEYDDWKTVSAGGSPEQKAAFEAMRDAFRDKDPGAFNEAAGKLSTLLRASAGPRYPSETMVRREKTYFSSGLYKKALLLYVLAFLAFLAAPATPPRKMYALALGLMVGGFVLHSYGLTLRTLISGRSPVSNMYESMIYLAWGILLFATIFEFIYKARYLGMVATVLGVATLAMADVLPLDPYVSPLVPVLRSYWLTIHVLTIMLGYAGLALAFGMAHLWSITFMFSPRNLLSLARIDRFTYKTIQVGVLFLGAGILLGGVWANQSWGRYWGWDPKETWALISLLAFLALLHGRIVGAVGQFGTAIGSILGFQLVLMTYYGVNYFLVGLHSYAGGAKSYGDIHPAIYVWAVFQLAFVALVTWFHRRHETSKPALAEADSRADGPSA